jgi:hypothetical protein
VFILKGQNSDLTPQVTSSQVPVYLAEISKAKKRGAIIVIQQLAIEWGILIMFFIGYGCSFIPGQRSFRTAWGIQWIPCVILMCGLPFVPESPRWLAKGDMVEEAIATLANIQAHGDKNDPLVQAEWEEITTTLAAERAAAKGWRKFVYNGMWRRTCKLTPLMHTCSGHVNQHAIAIADLIRAYTITKD